MDLKKRRWVEARQRGLALTGPDGLLKLFTKNVLETALNEEMTEHLRHEKHGAEEGRESTNVGNGARPKMDWTRCRGRTTGAGGRGWMGGEFRGQVQQPIVQCFGFGVSEVGLVMRAE